MAHALFESCKRLDDFAKSRFAKALLLLERAQEVVDLLKDSPDLFCRFYLAQAWMMLKQLATAEEVINDVVESSRTKPDRYTWDFYRWKGRILERAQEPSRALIAFHSALEKCPNDARLDLADIQRSIENLQHL